jgi:hypothetical protein
MRKKDRNSARKDNIMAKKTSDSKQKIIKKYIDLFYMTPSEVTARDIAALLQENNGLSTQVWEEMNVVEIELPGDSSIDFEPIDPSFQDPSDAAFIKNRNIKTIYAITVGEEDIKLVVPYFEQLVEKYAGFVCSDSADFNPVYAGTTAKI